LHAANFFIFSGSLLHTVYHFYKKDDVDITKLQEMFNKFLNYVKEIDDILEFQEETKRAMSNRRVNKKKKTVHKHKPKGFFHNLGDAVSEFLGAGAYYISPESRRRS
jgi:hypothetical protein